MLRFFVHESFFSERKSETEKSLCLNITLLLATFPKESPLLERICAHESIAMSITATYDEIRNGLLLSVC